MRPVKRYFSSATAARNASTMATATATSTTIRVFFTSVQKYGLWIAFAKCRSVGCPGNHVGVRLLIWSFGLNDVEIIQKTGKTITAKMARPSAFQPSLRTRARAHSTSPTRTIRRT